MNKSSHSVGRLGHLTPGQRIHSTVSSPEQRPVDDRDFMLNASAQRKADRGQTAELGRAMNGITFGKTLRRQ